MEFFEILQKSFPNAYPNIPRCGVYIPKNWQDLLMRMSKEIEDHLLENPIEGYQVDQIKEKFFGLRYYVKNADQTINDIIVKYEQESYKIGAYDADC